MSNDTQASKKNRNKEAAHQRKTDRIQKQLEKQILVDRKYNSLLVNFESVLFEAMVDEKSSTAAGAIWREQLTMLIAAMKRAKCEPDGRLTLKMNLLFEVKA